MNKRIRQAALKLMLLQEEFTKKELDEAAALVSGSEKESLIELLSTKPAKRSEPSDAGRQKGNGLSKVVEDLKETDPQRYQLLAEFEGMLRRETVLPTLEEVRRIGTSASKDFQAAKSRRETIPRLMEVFGTMPIGVLREKLGNVIEESRSTADDDNSYQRLARFLITGTPH